MAVRGPRLHIIEVTFAEACDFIDREHRHHAAPQGHKFSIGVVDDTGTLHGVATIGRPVARALNNRFTYEVTRLASDGTFNACSKLYAAAWRSAKERGIRRVITYTQSGETGASLRGAGWRKVADLSPRAGWNTPSRPRQARGTENIARTLWEITTHDAPPLPEPRYEMRYERPPQRNAGTCPECHASLPTTPLGRRARYCGSACKQRAYRRRQRAIADAAA